MSDERGGGGINKKYRFGFRILKRLCFVYHLQRNTGTLALMATVTTLTSIIGLDLLIMNQMKKEKIIDSKSNTPNNLQKYVRKEISQLFLLPNNFRKLRLIRGDWI